MLCCAGPFFPPNQDAKPAGRQEPLINGKMFKHIVGQGFYQIFWMFLFLYGLPRHFRQYAVHDDEEWLKVAGILFNTFIFAQIFNLINSRRIDDEYNVFEGEWLPSLRKAGSSVCQHGAGVPS